MINFQKTKTFMRERFGAAAAIILFFLLWELFTRTNILKGLLFPYPSVVFEELAKGLTEGDYLENLFITSTRVVSGFTIGGGLGLLLGMLMGWSKKIRDFVDPLISAIHPIPKFALLPIIIIAFGIGESSRIIMISIGAFFPMLINTLGGVLQINPTYYQVLENYGGSTLDVFKKVVLPGSLPYVLTGARLSLKSSLTLSIGIEMVFGNSGLGTMLYRGWTALDMTYVYSILIIVSIIGIGSNALLARAKKKLVPWHEDASTN